ncbi:UbiA family prenyltransferase [Microseira sp. BLCC-F43]|jgi:4-hydroxybenzoate polyprenyltransferase|uniref:UbiA family prenyltransferase n=1 Tax=Microseira sp. BLCC-F43 TaxID=3153602 RepID=UPI0035B9FDF0
MVNRWWVYQKERFPVLKHGLPIAVFSISAVSYSVLVHGRRMPSIAAMVVAFVSVFFFFLQMRITDEFKDFADDARYRPYRPVPRGLVSLRELGWLGVGTAIIQLGLAFWLSPSLALLLGLVWCYFGLMCKEFFVRDWLKAHPLAYMLSHLVYVPLINLYASACDWLVLGTVPSANLVWFLGASFFSGTAIEIGRKIRAPEGEEFGVETYSAIWGRGKAVVAWMWVLGLSAIAASIAASQINFTTPVSWLLGILLASVVGVGWLFLQKPVTKRAKLIEAMTALWTLLVYLCLGIVPLLLRL